MQTNKPLVDRLGFGNGHGELSFNKMVTFTALWVWSAVTLYTVLTLRQQPNAVAWTFGFGVIGAGFGLKGYMAAAARRTDTSSQTDSVALQGNLAEIITAIKQPPPERDALLGVQDAARVPEPHHD